MLWVQKDQMGSRAGWKILCKKTSVIFTKSRVLEGCGTRVTYVQGDLIIPTRGVQLEGGSPQSIHEQGFSLRFFSSVNHKQEFLLLQGRAVGSLQQHLQREGRGDALGWTAAVGQRAGVGEQGWGVSGSRTGHSKVRGPPHYRPSVGNARLVEFIGVFKGDCGHFIHNCTAFGRCTLHPCREEGEMRETISNLSW